MMRRALSLRLETFTSTYIRSITLKPSNLKYCLQIFLNTATVWALFSDQVRLYITNKTTDDVFAAITFLIFLAFFFEILINCQIRPDYFMVKTISRNLSPRFKYHSLQLLQRIISTGSFYFWLDLMATLVMIVEVDFFIPAQKLRFYSIYMFRFLGFSVKDLKEVPRSASDLEIETIDHKSSGKPENPTNGNSIMERAESKAEDGNSLRRKDSNLPRTIPLVRSLKKFRIDLQDTPKSKLGATLAELTSRRMIGLIMGLLIVFPMFNLVISVKSPAAFSLAIIQRMANLGPAFDPVAQTGNGLAVAIEDAVHTQSLIQLSINGALVFSDNSTLAALRVVEQQAIYIDGSSVGNLPPVTGIFNIKPLIQRGAFLRIILTIFVWIILQVGMYVFTLDVNRLVLQPIERMVDLVLRISKNPLAVDYKMPTAEDGFREGMETTMLMQTINKIGGLMRVCFGEAGAGIISRNLARNNKKLNLMGSGTLVNAIFGFCDVRRFTDTTECLQEEVMLFVNRIAYILHGIVVQCGGSANKNIGDAFLITWKIDDSMSAQAKEELADQALLTYCRTLIAISRFHDFICDFSLEASNRMKKRFPSYRVQIGCGLHVGWAIEGAIGSHRKIDASYLSPHVNMSEYLEASTKKYGLSILMSGSFHDMLSIPAKECCRIVDRICKKNSSEPLTLYTYDTDLSVNFSDPNISSLYLPQPKPPLQPADNSSHLGSSNRASAFTNFRRSSMQRLRMLSIDRQIVFTGMSRRSISKDAKGPDFVSEFEVQKESTDDLKQFQAPVYTSISPKAPISSASKLTVPLIELFTTEPAPTIPRVSSRRKLSSGRATGAGSRRKSSRADVINSSLSPIATSIRNRQMHSLIPEHPPEPPSDSSGDLGWTFSEPLLKLQKYHKYIWKLDEDLRILRHKFTKEFRVLWNDATEAFMNGDWRLARQLLLNPVVLEDGVANYLLQYMDSYSNIAPSDWQGWRVDDEE